MARLSKQKAAEKRLQAKTLYIKGIDIHNIADILEMASSTIKKWATEDNWEDARHSQFMALSELRNTILESFMILKDGGKPLIKPDEAAKYASAFEKLSDKKKVLSYMYESYDLLTEEVLKEIQNKKKKKDKEQLLDVLKIIRAISDKVLTKLTTETINN